jgi:peptidoglycan/xylan/chitin deacetylase (PgdA/CDA1 family)
MLYGMLIMVYFGTSFALAFLPCTNFHHPVTCQGAKNENRVALTFDDGPDPLKTPFIINILKNHSTPATFFCIGKNLAGNEQLVKQIFDEGHLLGNHSFSHSTWFDLFPSKRMRQEMLETDRLINGITGKSPLFFRPPYGVVNPMVSNALKKMHWKTICWNIRSMDTMGYNNHKILNDILGRLKPGSIILLHDKTVFVEKCLDELLTGIQKKGFKVVPLDKLLDTPAYA